MLQYSPLQTNQPIVRDLGYPLGYLHYSVFFQLNLPIKTALCYHLGYICYTRHQSRQTYVTVEVVSLTVGILLILLPYLYTLFIGMCKRCLSHYCSGRGNSIRCDMETHQGPLCIQPYGPHLPLGGLHVRGSLPRTSSRTLQLCSCIPLEVWTGRSATCTIKNPTPVLPPPRTATLKPRSFQLH